MKPANLGDRPRRKARSGGAVHISHRQYLGIGLLLCSVLYTQHSGVGSKLSPLASSPQVQETAQPTIPMLDEGKGLIHLDVSVTKADGEPVSGLSREDFELLDEGLPQKILSFHAFSEQSAGPEPPVQVILFLDTLCRIYPSCMSKADALRAQAGIEAFVRQDNGHLHQPVSIFGISDDGLWTVPHHDSTDGNSLASDLSSGKMIVLNRRLDALRALAFIATAQRRKRGRKVMLWIGPGCGKGTGIFPANHNAGRKTFDPIYWFTTLFREARLSIDDLPVDQEETCAPGYQLYLNGPRTVHDADDRFLYKKVLAIQSGGSVANDTNDLVAEMNRCLRRPLNFYTLSFVPPVAVQPHEYHSLQVRVDTPGSVAHMNTSYYDEPFYSDQPNPDVQRVTVGQLDQLLSETNSRDTDGRAERLSKIELTERLSLANLSALTADFRNRNLQQTLVAVADLSAFLGPPPAEIPNQAAPDAAAKQHMLVHVKDYLEKTISKLPNFYATRTTVRYEEMPERDHGRSSAGSQPLGVVELSKARVLYRDGDEVVESRDSERNDSSDERLTTRGTFGPILADVRRAVDTPGRMKWVRWESGPEGRRGVFEFEVSAAESTYFEGGCCLPDADGENSFRIQAGYRGEIAINPEDGTIFRLQQQFDMQQYVPMDRDEVLIDYGPVKIGGKTYFCPTRSVSLARGRSIISLKEWDQSFLSYGPYSTKMNDMRFSNYHVFRAESRILPGFKPDE
jgi:VWFA-related protein